MVWNSGTSVTRRRDKKLGGWTVTKSNDPSHPVGKRSKAPSGDYVPGSGFISAAEAGFDPKTGKSVKKSGLTSEQAAAMSTPDLENFFDPNSGILNLEGKPFKGPTGAAAAELDKRIRAGEFGTPSLSSQNLPSAVPGDAQRQVLVDSGQMSFAEALEGHNAELNAQNAAAPTGQNANVNMWPFGAKGGLATTAKVGLGLAVVGAALAATAGLSAPAVARAASGKVVSRFGTSAQTAAAQATNSVIAKKSTSYILKLASAAKNPMFVLGAISTMIGTYPWAAWGNKETIDTLVFARKDAVEAGDTALVREVDALLDDVLQTDFWNALPVSNVISSTMENRKASLLNIRASEKASQVQIIREQEKEAEWVWNGEKWVRAPPPKEK